MKEKPYYKYYCSCSITRTSYDDHIANLLNVEKCSGMNAANKHPRFLRCIVTHDEK